MNPMNCYFCGSSIDPAIPIYRNSTCPNCKKDLRICLNCEFYSPGSHWDCREQVPEPVYDKERANFCDYFRPGTGRRGNTRGSTSTQKGTNGRDAFNSLFKE